MISSYKKPDFFKQKGRSSDLFLLIVEGENTERLYFERLKAICGRESNIRIKTETTSGGDGRSGEVVVVRRVVAACDH